MAKKKESVSVDTRTPCQIYGVEPVYGVGEHFFVELHHAENYANSNGLEIVTYNNNGQDAENHANSNGLEIVTYTKNGEDTANTGE